MHSGVPDFDGLKFTQDARVPERYPDVFRVPSEPLPGLSLDPCRIHQGQNGGYQALNLAVLLGARRVLLLGYDMQHGPNGEVHHHGKHPPGLNNPGARQLAEWACHFSTTLADLARAGVEVINCSRETALTCYPRMTIQKALRI